MSCLLTLSRRDRPSPFAVDGLVFSPTAHDHSLDYRSACLHLTDAQLLDDGADSDEKVRVLSAVTDTVTGYDRTRVVGRPSKTAVDRTTVIRCRIAAVSCKQRYGGFDGGRPPDAQGPDGVEEGWKGVMPCWTQWGDLRGYGIDRDEVEARQRQRSATARAFAEAACGGEDEARIEGLGARTAKA